MGGEQQTSPIKVFCFGNKDNILQTIFKEELPKIENYQWERRILKEAREYMENETKKSKTETIEWIATLYPDITEDNINDLFDDLKDKLNIPKENDEEELNIGNLNFKEKMKNIVIIFGRENAKIIIAFLNDVKKIYLPQIAIITDEKISEEEEDFQLNDNRYLAIIKKDFKKNLMLYLWEKECYYNERGNIILNLPGKIETNNYINIILTGISRAGKSTLINILSQKLVSLETSVMESVTDYIREYKLITSENGGFLSGIRFYDTPGLTIIKDKNKKKNTFDEVISLINKKIKECKDARDDIHLIYFMIRELQNLESYIGFFEKIIELNKKRGEEGKKKIYMIFILNKGDDQIEESLKNFLRNHGLSSLLEGDAKTNDKKVNYKEKYLKKEKSLKKEIENNIVQINLIKNKKYGNPIYGFNSLFKKLSFS